MVKFQISLAFVSLALQTCSAPRTANDTHLSYRQGGEFHEINNLSDSLRQVILRQADSIIIENESLNNGQIVPFDSSNYTKIFAENATHFSIKYRIKKDRGSFTEYGFVVGKENMRIKLLYFAIP